MKKPKFNHNLISRGLILLLLAVFLFSGQSSWAGFGDHSAEDHKGPFIQAGALGAIDVGLGDNIRLFDMGPGALIGLGYNWGLFGVRGNFHYAQMDGRGALANFLSSDLFGGNLDLKISPLGNSDIMFQPYLLAGIGTHYLEYNLFGGLAKNGDWGLATNGGLGFDLFIMENLAITLETNIRPTLFHQTGLGRGTGDDSYDLFFYDFMGGITYVFGKEAKERPVAAADPEPEPAPVVPPPKKYKKGEKIDLRGKINFKTNSAEVLPSAYPVLDDAVAKMKAHPEIAMVEIEGHTDSRGADAYNMSLSERRAASVKKYFESKGIESSRLSSKGYGETQPIASNTTNEGQLDNRRIVFRVTEFKDR